MRGLLAAGLAVLGAAGWAFTRRRSARLGKTARTGARTGSIGVDMAIVNQRVDAVLDEMAPCGAGTALQPVVGDGSIPAVTVRDAATGAARSVKIRIDAESRPHNVLGAGHLETQRRADGTIVQTVSLTPNMNLCAPRHVWRDFFGDVLHHELAHAADPTLILEARGRRTYRYHRPGTRAYFNSPAEMTAQVAEVERQLLRYVMHARPADIRAMSPNAFVREGSAKFRVMAPHLTEQNKRRVYRMAARLKESLGV